MNVPLAGKCLCGGIRLTATPKMGEGKVVHVEACHCSMCQVWHGAMGMSITLKEPPVLQQGEGLLQVYKSSEWGRRKFCKVCGTSVCYEAPSFGYFGISPGVLEDKSNFSLHKEIFIDKKPDYFCFAGERPTLTEAQFNAQFEGPGTADSAPDATACST